MERRDFLKAIAAAFLTRKSRLLNAGPRVESVTFAGVQSARVPFLRPQVDVTEWPYLYRLQCNEPAFTMMDDFILDTFVIAKHAPPALAAFAGLDEQHDSEMTRYPQLQRVRLEVNDFEIFQCAPEFVGFLFDGAGYVNMQPGISAPAGSTIRFTCEPSYRREPLFLFLKGVKIFPVPGSRGEKKNV